MTAKLTIKQENFCLAYIQTGNASQAYRIAYNAEKMKPASINRKAAFTLDQGKIRARLEELHSEERERHAVTVESLTKELKNIMKAAFDAGQFSASNQSAMGMAKLHGLLIEKKELTGKDGGPLEVRTLADFYATNS